MGGRIAEETFLGSITTGASNDIEKATELARAMVCEYGMSDLGPLTFGKKEEQIFLGREIAQHRDYSEETAIRIDSEVRKIVTDQYERARKIIEENRDTMVRLAEALLEHESLDGVQIRRIVAGLTLDDAGETSGPEFSRNCPLPRNHRRSRSSQFCRQSPEAHRRRRKVPSVPPALAGGQTLNTKARVAALAFFHIC